MTPSPRWLWIVSAALLGVLQVGTAEARSVTCLGRIEPADGVIRLAGPSGPGSVIAELNVAEGDWVEEGQAVAKLDDHALHRAGVARLEAQLANAKREFQRVELLSQNSAASVAKLDATELVLRIAKADLAEAKARLELSVVRSPVRAQVLEIHARPGERIGPEGLLELGRTDQMYAVAEVYETDIAAVKAGQSARVRSPALPVPLTGKVERVGLKVGRLDVLGSDPIAKTDARVVEVYIRLDDGQQVAGLTNLQVEVEITP